MRKGWKLSQETKKRISKGNARYWLGKHHSEETKEKIRASLKGRKYPPRTVEHSRNLSEALKGRKRPDLSRALKACVFCGVRDVPFHADHIKPFSRFPELRFEVSNGRTLCIPCHKETPTYGGRLQSSLTAATAA